MERAGGATRAPRFGLMLALLALLAFALREHYVLTVITDYPIRGDVAEYMAYAWNLVHDGVFGHQWPPTPPVADDYRTPGYPWLIALCMQALPQDPAWRSLGPWYPLMQQVQVVLGTLTVLLTTLLARQWLPATWAIAAGLALALWPHHVAATNTLLSEVVLGFCLMAALFAFARAWRTQRTAWYVVSALAFGYAYLVNPLVLLFPPCLAALVAWHGARRPAAVLLGVFLVPVVALGVRNATLDHPGRGADRALINLVQGSWPGYHLAAHGVVDGDPDALAVFAAIDAEYSALRADRRAGLARIAARMAVDPLRYATWYATKPFLLWGWRIGIGSSDIAFYQVMRSPFEHSPLLRAAMVTYRTLNPVLTALTLLAALALTVSGVRRGAQLPAVATGALALYVTVVHLVLQAEPRYAIAYRGLEAVLVVAALAWCMRKARGARHSDAPKAQGID